MRKFKGSLAFLLSIIFTLMLVMTPIEVYADEDNSKYNDIQVIFFDNQDGKITGIIGSSTDVLKDTSSVKVYTKFLATGYDSQESDYVEGNEFEFNQKNESGDYFELYSESENFSKVGEWYVDKIEITNLDNSIDIIYNSKFYNDLNEYIIDIEYPIYSCNSYLNSDSEVAYDKVVLGEEQIIKLDLKEKEKFNEVYLTFVCDSYTHKEKVIKAKRIEDRFEANITYDDSFDTGTWYLEKVTMSDKNNNTIEDNNVNYMLYYDVVSENADSTGPVINSIKLTSNIYDHKAQEKTKIIIDISDDLSGYERGVILLNNKDNPMDVNMLSIVYNSENNQHEVNDLSSLVNGNYTINSIIIEDKVGNQTKYTEEDFSDFELEVINRNEKFTSETMEILSINNNKKVINVGEELDIEMEVLSSKNLDKVTIGYINESGMDFTLNLLPKEVDKSEGIYKFGVNKSSLNKYSPNGQYYIQYIYIHSGRSYLMVDMYENNFDDLEFIYNNENGDNVSPEVIDLNISDQVVKPGDNIEVTIEAKDDYSGFSNGEECVEAELSYQCGSYYLKSKLEYKGDNIFKGNIEIPSYITTGVYRVSICTVKDLGGNQYNFYDYPGNSEEIFKDTNIIVTNNINDIIYPQINTNIKNGQEYINSVIPEVSIDDGTIEMTLNGEEYYGNEISKLGDYVLKIKGLSEEGLVVNDEINFKVVGEINKDTISEELVNKVINSISDTATILINKDDNIVSKSIFEGLKGIDKKVEFKLSDGTIWMFNCKYINAVNFEDVDLGVSHKASNKDVDKAISKLDNKASIINLNQVGELPANAKVKVKLREDISLSDKDLYLYYYNSATKEVEKLDNMMTIDENGYLVLEVTHGGDYFVSEDSSLNIIKENEGTNSKSDEENINNNNSNVVNSTSSSSKPKNILNTLKTGDFLLYKMVILLFIGSTVVIGGTVFIKRKYKAE